MKHAYLIIAHNEFGILQRLVSALDDDRNDIYIHFDRKVRELPEVKVDKSGLHVLKNRIDVKWGTVSQIRCEYAIWREALNNGPYGRYTLLSGTHYPLMEQEALSTYFEKKDGKNLFPYMDRADDYQIDMKMQRINVAPCSIIWRAALKAQRLFGIRINRDLTFYNAGNWASLTEDAVKYLCANEGRIVKKYRWSFCGDEFFAPTELMSSDLAGSVEFSRDLLKFEIGRSNAKTYGAEDYDELIGSGCAFARKFSETDVSIIDKLTGNERDR